MGCNPCRSSTNLIQISSTNLIVKSGGSGNKSSKKTCGKDGKEEMLDSSLVFEVNKEKMINRLERVETDYKIIKKLGKGNHAVFKVLHLASGLFRAMKIIKKETIEKKLGTSDFLKEMDILMQMSHPNIIKIFEYYEDRVNYYLIIEYINGGELYEAISQIEDFSEEKAALLMHQIFSAVNYLHSQNIIHRDLKSENILVETNNKSGKSSFNIKLIDFDTCCQNEKKITDNDFVNRIESPYYVAPEVIDGKYDNKCDLWSIGVILYVILCGYPPFTSFSHVDLINKIKKGEYSMNSIEWSQISSPAKDLVKKLLKTNPKSRLSAAEALKHNWIKEALKKEEPLKVQGGDVFSDILNNIKFFNNKEKLKQATIVYIIHFLFSHKEFEELAKIFRSLDQNGDGRLTYFELRKGFEQFHGKTLTDVEMHELISLIDTDQDGFISYEEFLKASISRKQIFEEKNLQFVFEKFDKDKDGRLSAEEIKSIFNNNGDNIYINGILATIKENENGFLTYQDFIALIKGVVENKFGNDDVMKAKVEV